MSEAFWSPADNEQAIDLKTKCIVTVVLLMASGVTDASLTYHLQNARNHGVTRKEMAAAINGVTREEIVAAANRLTLDTVYVLKNR